MLQLEAEFGLGVDGYYGLTHEQRVKLLAYYRVTRDPKGEGKKSKGLGAILRRLPKR